MLVQGHLVTRNVMFRKHFDTVVCWSTEALSHTERIMLKDTLVHSQDTPKHKNLRIVHTTYSYILCVQYSKCFGYVTNSYRDTLTPGHVVTRNVTRNATSITFSMLNARWTKLISYCKLVKLPSLYQTYTVLRCF